MSSAHLLPDYVNQVARFEIDVGFGCTNSGDDSALALLTLSSWTVVIPIISIVVYYRKSSKPTMSLIYSDTHLHILARVARTFYLHSKDVGRVLQSDGSVSRTNYSRLLVLASIDILITLPVGITFLALSVIAGLELALCFQQDWISFDTASDLLHPRSDSE